MSSRSMQVNKPRAALTNMACALVLSSCSQTIAPWDGPVLTEPREQLTVRQLEKGDVLPLLDMSFFARPAWATDATDMLGHGGNDVLFMPDGTVFFRFMDELDCDYEGLVRRADHVLLPTG